MWTAANSMQYFKCLALFQKHHTVSPLHTVTQRSLSSCWRRCVLAVKYLVTACIPQYVALSDGQQKVKWVTVKFLWTDVACTVGWLYTEGTGVYCDCFVGCVSCTVLVLTGFVMCGCFGNMCTCIYCVLYCLYCVFCVVSFMYIYSHFFCLY